MTRKAFVYGFAIFAGFFGAGNLILPGYLGFQAGEDWAFAALGFVITGVLIPMMALIGHARLQGTMLDFGNKVSRLFSLILCISIYLIAITLPSPRTAAVTHEMAIEPYVSSSSLTTSIIYFGLVLLIAWNRGKVVDLLGKYLTPLIGLIMLAIIGLSIFLPSGTGPGSYQSPMISGFLEGYQTYDALAGLLMGGILVLSIQNAEAGLGPGEQRKLIRNAGLIAMAGLGIIYMGLIFTGAQVSSELSGEINRTSLLRTIANRSLGSIGSVALSILVALACFTTAVGITVGTGDFFKGLFRGSDRVYYLTLVLACLIGVLVGQMNVSFIIHAALPVLMLLYPVTVVLIVLNLFSDTYAPRSVFRILVAVAILFSIPDVLKGSLPEQALDEYYRFVPFSQEGLGWVVPCLLTFLLLNTPAFMSSITKALGRS